MYHAASDDYFASRGIRRFARLAARDDGSQISFAPYTRRPAG
jgi:hypothetical protein